MGQAKILVVEDDWHVAKEMKDKLAKLGYAVSAIVSSGEEVVENVQENAPELVLMDIVLKGEMDGIEAAGQIRNLFNIPVVFITAYTDKEFLERAKLAEPYGYVTKPYQDRELHTAIEMALYKHKTEKKLRESEERYRRITEAVTDYLFTVRIEDGKPVETMHNPACVGVTGYTQEEFASKPYLWFEMVHEDDRKAVQEQAEQVLLGQQVPPLEHRIYHKDGAVRWVKNTLVPHYDPQGKLLSYDGLISDITDRRRAEETLQKSEKQASAAIEAARGFTFSYDITTGKVEWGGAIKEITGYTPEEFASVDIDGWAERIHPDDRDEVLSILQEAVQELDRATAEYRFRTKKGYVTLASISITERDEDGKAVRLAGILQDITELKQAQEERKDLELQLRQAQKMEAIGTLAGGIAHDFNNILTPIIIQTELALIDAPDEGRKRFKLQHILEAAHRAKDLVKQILTFSRQAEQQEIPLQIIPILKQTLRLLRSSLPTTIEIREDLKTESDTVLADPTQIHQVLMNLCTNAGHAMREKGGVLAVSLEDIDLDADAVTQYPDLRSGPYLKLTVSDTGHGIEQELLDRIFDPFYTTKDRGEGTGMGLAVVHGIVKGYGGAITVNSEVEKGTAFQVFLPRIERKVSIETGPAVTLPKGNERILLVDDEKVIVDSVQAMLEYLGYEVIMRTSSIEALEAFRATPEEFDLVITDQTMPNMTGKELAQELMQIRSDIPVILSTGFSEQITKDEAMAMGISDYVMKPIVMDDLAKRIRKLLDQERGT